MHYLDLDICTKGIHKEMRFLITDIGSKDILLGYPWLASFEPRFSWRHAVIDERALPVIISSINPRIIRQQPVIAATLSEEEKHHIIRTLESQSTIQGVSTKLAIQAGQIKSLQKFRRYMNDLRSCLVVKHCPDFCLQGHGIMPSTLNQPHQTHSPAKFTL
jgi:hypothetical protein